MCVDMSTRPVEPNLLGSLDILPAAIGAAQIDQMLGFTPCVQRVGFLGWNIDSADLRPEVGHMGAKGLFKLGT